MSDLIEGDAFVHLPCLCVSCGHELKRLSPTCPKCGATPTLDGRYVLLSVLGVGASGTVYRSRRLVDGVDVAVKELLIPRGNGGVSCSREAKAFSALSHPGLPRALEHIAVGQGARQAHYIVQELIVGRPLDEELAERRYTSQEVFLIVGEVLEILAHLHVQRPPLVHRDVKPENILRRDGGRLVLVDLGSASVTSPEGPATHFTTSGTIGYMPTEQIAGVVRPTNDIYAVGALAVGLLTRKQPSELLDDELHLAWKGLVDLHPSQARFIDAMLNSDPRKRPADAHALAQRARQLALRSPRRSAGSKGATWALLVLLACVVFAVGFNYFSVPPDTEQEYSTPSVPEHVPASETDGDRGTTSLWRCDPDAASSSHLFERLEPGESLCDISGECRDFTEQFEELDLAELCVAPDDSTLPGIVTSRANRFSTMITGDGVECRLQSDPFSCGVTCFHETDGEDPDSLRRAFAEYLQYTRDTYGVESDGMIQGTPSVPRREHRWRRGSTLLSLELIVNLCPPRDHRSFRASFRTRYTLMQHASQRG